MNVLNRLLTGFMRTHWRAILSRFHQTCRRYLKNGRNTDTSALMSNLQKNEELKSVLLRETPWVLRRKLKHNKREIWRFCLTCIKMREALKSALDKLRQMQSEGGGFAWFKGWSR